jgi:nickel superoxide dismutase
MNRTLLPCIALGAIAALASSNPSSAPSTPATTPAAAPVHCLVPCGVYGDKMRIDMLMEDATTIEKGMTTLQAMDQESSPSKNQMVRWVMNKDDHSQKIQETVADYWLAQRIKTPKDTTDAAAMAKYHGQLELLHRITVSAMKCKQTTDKGHVENLRKLALEFSETYFTGEDLEHIKSHHAGEHK